MCYLCLYCCCCSLRTGAVFTAIFGMAMDIMRVVSGSLVLTLPTDEMDDWVTGGAVLEDVEMAQTLFGVFFVLLGVVGLVRDCCLLTGALMEIQMLVLIWLIIQAFLLANIVLTFVLRGIYLAVFSPYEAGLIFLFLFDLYLFWVVVSYYDELKEETDTESD